MRTRITGEEFGEALATYSASAFRLEQQRAYQVSAEAENFSAFLAGTPVSPAEVPGFRQWAAQIRRQTAAGRIMTRVRVHDEPMTDYQRWLRWGDGLNMAAGEVLRYVARQNALAAGFDPSQGDWWLLDENRLILMDFDADGTPTGKTLTDVPELVAEAINRRDVALQISTPAVQAATWGAE